MRCEVCGRRIHEIPTRAIIEGAKLTVCLDCSKHGRVIEKKATGRYRGSIIIPAKSVPIAVQKKISKVQVELTKELVEHYPSKIRHAREKIGISQEELGKKIREKASVLRKLETGKMTPNNMLVTKLEHALKIKLLVPVSNEKVPTDAFTLKTRHPTLGDLIKIPKKNGEEPEERKP